MTKQNDNKTVLTSDINLRFPEFVLLKASAGSGKTHALSLRFVQFMLSSKIPHNYLQNILAITFTKNASREMKERILSWLKSAYFGDPEKTEQILSVARIPREDLPARAQTCIDMILSNYTDFQVETIDSFMAKIFKSSALDLGVPPDFEIVLDNTEIIQYAYYRYLRKVTPHSAEGDLFRNISSHIVDNLKGDSSFTWDPTSSILDNLIGLNRKIASSTKPLVIDNYESQKTLLYRQITQCVNTLEELLQQSKLEISSRCSFRNTILPAVWEQNFSALVDCTYKTAPLNKSQSRDYPHINEEWERLVALIHEYRSCYARDFYKPYLIAHQSLEATLRMVKKQQETVFIEDINKELSNYVNAGLVPDIYLRLGDRIYHYLIDEFQDTAPIQWNDMLPLIENSVSQDGSLFVVGDTKQAIYGFRDADYRIMKALEDKIEQPFPSVDVQVKELKENYRSHEAVLDYTKKIFLENLNHNPNYETIAAYSGLNHFQQEVIKKHAGIGYVESVILKKDPETLPEKDKIQQLVQELKQRGYSYSDIAILAFRNDVVVEISTWLNEINIPFIPYSSLDIRTRKIIGEMIALLTFLDSPLDDLSFSTFILGDIFKAKLHADGLELFTSQWQTFLFNCHQNKTYPLYTEFRKQFSDIWNVYFGPLFKTVGYYPLYDLVTMIYRRFDIFNCFPKEEATLIKLLETIKEVEGMGKNDLQEFLSYANEEEGQNTGWQIDVPLEIDAVRIMSVHKAKGLGFPVVIMLTYGDRYHSPDFYLAEDHESIRVYKLNQDLVEENEELLSLYDTEKNNNRVNQLNALYVALTRAKAELYVVGVKGRDKYPFDLLGEEDFFSAKTKPAACPDQHKSDSPPGEILQLTSEIELPPNMRESLNYDNILRGNMMHEIMDRIEYIQSDWSTDIYHIIQSLNYPESSLEHYQDIAAKLIAYFTSSEIKALFVTKPGRQVLREFSFCNADGHLYRMDRVILDTDSITILDYKSGFDSNDAKETTRKIEYASQIRNYISIIKDIYPGKPVKGILAYIDLNTWETVE